MLQPETQTILEALQPLVKPEMGWVLRLPYHEDGGELFPFVWSASEQGEFNLWNLLQAEGWSKATTLEAALENWSLSDRTGAVNGATWLLPSADEAGILLDEAAKPVRVEHYQALINWLEENLQNLTAFRLSCAADNDSDAYSGVIVVGEAADGWFGLAPIIPHATPERDFPFDMDLVVPSMQLLSSPLESQLQAILAQLGTIQIYGYYGGGYNQVHDHKLVYALGTSQAAAIEQVLQLAGGIETKGFNGFKPKSDADPEIKQIESLNHFLRQTFSQLRLDRVCFWNRENFYISGETSSGESTGDRVGVVLRSRFTYNP
jgi:hypothetical protein